MTIKARASLLAVNLETVEGEPEFAASGNDFVPLRPDFTMAPETEEIENEEIQASIETAATVPGIERVNASVPLYPKHSGTEGQAPTASPIYESFFGAKNVIATERDTVAGSTVSAINVDTGEGVEFARGHLALVKDAINGRSLRFIESVAGDVLTPAFNLPGAPGTGVLLGKPINYLPLNDSHPTITLDLFRGNGGAREVASGCRVTEMAFEAAAGQLIGGSFTFQGRKFHLNPMKVTASNKFLDFNVGGSELNITLDEKTYRSPDELADAIQSKMNELTTGITVVWNSFGASAGKFTISKASGTLNILWKTGIHGSDNTDTHVGTLIGYSDAANDTGSLSYVSDNEQNWSSSILPAFDPTDPNIAKSVDVLFGDEAGDTQSWCVQSLNANFANEVAENLCMRSETAIDSVEILKRTITVEMVLTAQEHDIEVWKHYRRNDTVKFQFGFGKKTGGQWQGGYCGGLYLPSAKVKSFEHDNANGIVALNATIQAFPLDGKPGGYLAFV